MTVAQLIDALSVLDPLLEVTVKADRYGNVIGVARVWLRSADECCYRDVSGRQWVADLKLSREVSK